MISKKMSSIKYEYHKYMNPSGRDKTIIKKTKNSTLIRYLILKNYNMLMILVTLFCQASLLFIVPFVIGNDEISKYISRIIWWFIILYVSDLIYGNSLITFYIIDFIIYSSFYSLTNSIIKNTSFNPIFHINNVYYTIIDILIFITIFEITQRFFDSSRNTKMSIMIHSLRMVVSRLMLFILFGWA